MFFFFNDTATTEIYTLSLHDALPIYRPTPRRTDPDAGDGEPPWHHPTRSPLPLGRCRRPHRADRKSTRLNSSHANISYAVFCLKIKNAVLRRRAGHVTYLS